MANANIVIIIGNLTRDPELRYTASGAAVADLGMAVNRKWKDQEETCFIDLTAWAKSAETIAEYCHKGDPLYVEGRLKMDAWETRNGEKRQKLVVVVENFQLLGGRREHAPEPERPAPARREQTQPVDDDPVYDDDIPF